MTALKQDAPKLVRDLMHIGVTTCSADTPMAEAVRLLLRQNLESLIVLDGNGHAAGVFGKREAVKAYGQSDISGDNLQTLTVAEAMCPTILEVPPHIPATAAAQLMLDHGARDIYLLHYAGGIGWPAAVLRFNDVLRYLAAESDEDIADMGVGAKRKTPFEIFKERYPNANP